MKIIKKETIKIIRKETVDFSEEELNAFGLILNTCADLTKETNDADLEKLAEEIYEKISNLLDWYSED